MITEKFILLTVLTIASISVINIILTLILICKKHKAVLLILINGYILIHSGYFLAIEWIYSDYVWSKNLGPFALMYGPLLYFTTLSSRKKNLTKKILILHCSPIILSTLAYIVLIIFDFSDESQFRSTYQLISVALTPISMLGYAIIPFIKIDKYTHEVHDSRTYIIILSRILLGFIAIILLSTVGNRDFIHQIEAANMVRFLIYFCLLMLNSSLFVSIIFQLKKHSIKENRINDSHQNIQTIHLEKYKKSQIPQELLNAYSERLLKLMSENKYYLDANLTLKSLAQSTNISVHHLTQVLNLKLQKNFSDFINELRIQRASELIEKEEYLKINDIAKAAGFVSRSTFNRHFKALKGITPSEYLQTRVK